MTRTPIELTRRAFAVANDGDFDAMDSYIGPDSVWDLTPWGLGTHAGLTTIRQFIELWTGSFDEYEVVADEMLDLGGGVVFTVATQSARTAGTRGQLQLRSAPVFVWAGGWTERVTFYRDVEEARAAAQRLAASRA